MTSETKQDVFNDAINALYKHSTRLFEVGKWGARYNEALPDGLPVIPKNVSDLLVAQKQHYKPLSNVLGPVHELGIMRQQSSNPTLNWVSAHENEFARTWVLEAWKVKETGKVVKL